MKPAYISFDNGVCRRLHRPDDWQAEVAQACEATEQGATVLSEFYVIVGLCTRLVAGGPFVARVAAPSMV